MIDTLRRLLAKLHSEDQAGLETPAGETAGFVLKYHDLTVGVLTLDSGVWRFEYSPEFQKQHDIRPIIDFPDISKTYEAERLWPFFVARIPSISQPKVQEAIEKEGLDRKNSAELLGRFGQRTISNPFLLEPTRRKATAR
jgi:HipA-like protein